MTARRVTINGVERIDPRHTRAWRKLRDQVVREEPTCRLRIVGICTTVSTTADHIIPVTVRPDLAMNRTNCRGACRPCNDARGRLPDAALNRDSAGPQSGALSIFSGSRPAAPRTSRVTLVCGPPCGGKSTYVEQNAQPGDVVIDFDTIAQELGSPDRWQHAHGIAAAAEAETRKRIDSLRAGQPAWAIRSLPDPRERDALAARLDARVVLLDPGEQVCIRRADGRPSGTRKAIRLWYWRAAKA